MTATIHSAYTQGIDGKLFKIRAEKTEHRSELRIIGLPERFAREIAETATRVAKTMGVDARDTIVECSDIDPGAGPLSRSRDTNLGLAELPVILAVLSAHGTIGPKALERTAAAATVHIRGSSHRDTSCGAVRGATVIAERVAREGLELLTAQGNGRQAAAECPTTFTVESVADAVEMLRTGRHEPVPPQAERPTEIGETTTWNITPADLHVLEVAAAGYHDLLVQGAESDPDPTRYGLYAARLLPALQTKQARETTMIHSVAGILHDGCSRMTTAPLRAPHHTASEGAIAGSRRGRPGEVSLAHNGVLVLSQPTEFYRGTLDALASARMEGEARFYPTWMHKQIRYPARCLLATIVHHHEKGKAPEKIARITRTGAIRIRTGTTSHKQRADPGDAVLRVKDARARLQTAPEIQSRRSQEPEGTPTHGVARTIAALEGADTITDAHMAEAKALTAEAN